jgi:hypothetical protein
VVPVELGYPDNDYRKQGPKPTTFAVSCATPGMTECTASAALLAAAALACACMLTVLVVKHRQHTRSWLTMVLEAFASSLLAASVDIC